MVENLNNFDPWDQRRRRGNLNWLQHSGFFYSHLSDFFRTAVTWKYGGWYLDYDVVVLKPLDKLKNVIAYVTPLSPPFLGSFFFGLRLLLL